MSLEFLNINHQGYKKALELEVLILNNMNLTSDDLSLLGKFLI